MIRRLQNLYECLWAEVPEIAVEQVPELLDILAKLHILIKRLDKTGRRPMFNRHDECIYNNEKELTT